MQFGVNQIVKNIKGLKTNIKDIDKGFPINLRCQIFPSIIVNERSMQTPLMAYIFDKRFGELMKEVKLNNFVVHPLALIHISDLEQMEDYLHIKPTQFFKILRYHLRNPSFIPPFYNTLNLMNIKPNFKKTKQLFGRLILKYQKKP